MNIRKAGPEDVGPIMDLIRRRIAWMDERGIDHWNREDYFSIFPELYFRENISSFLVAEQEGRPIGAMAVFDHDALWQDRIPSWYIHNFVADPEQPGTGAALLRFVENMALAREITRMRLDTNLTDHSLADYYEAKGYRARGLVRRGDYLGVKREKFLDRENPPYDAAGFFDSGDLREEGLLLLLEKTTPADPAKGWVPAYHFALVDDWGEKMGSCELRVGHNERLYFGGNIGYQVEEAFRGRHLAARACRLLFRLAAKHGLGYVIISCRPDNIPSRRAAERAGCELLEIAPIPPWHDLYQRGEQEGCIYGISL